MKNSTGCPDDQIDEHCVYNSRVDDTGLTRPPLCRDAFGGDTIVSLEESQSKAHRILWATPEAEVVVRIFEFDSLSHVDTGTPPSLYQFRSVLPRFEIEELRRVIVCFTTVFEKVVVCSGCLRQNLDRHLRVCGYRGVHTLNCTNDYGSIHGTCTRLTQIKRKTTDES